MDSVLPYFACSDASRGQDGKIPLDVGRSHRGFESHRRGPDDAKPPGNSDDHSNSRDQDLEPFWQKLNNDRRNRPRKRPYLFNYFFSSYLSDCHRHAFNTVVLNTISFPRVLSLELYNLQDKRLNALCGMLSGSQRPRQRLLESV